MSFFSAQPTTITSLRFTASDLTALKVDLKHKKIIHLYQQPLPVGAIAKGEVTNPEALSAAVNTALAKTRSQNQSVVIGSPEDRTLLGLANIQGVPKDKLEEAMKWQIDEIFPGGTDSLYTDWKISPNLTAPTQAVVVAAPKRAIDGFVTSVVQAGAKPIVCEPTSVSLARLVPKGEAVLVAEIRSAASTIVLVDTASTPRFSTIVIDPNQLINEIHRLVNYYQQKYQTLPTKVYICGEGATSEWLAFIASQTKIPTFNMPLPPVTNLPTTPHRFAVSLSLATTPLLPPSHQDTLNLLPKPLAEEYSQQEEKKQLSFGFQASIITTIITAAIMGIALIRVQMGLASLNQAINAQSQQTQSTPYSQLAKEAENANTQARLLKRLPTKDKLALIPQELYPALPAGVSINSYTINLAEKVVLVNGFSQSRDSLLTFKSNLEKSQVFAGVNIPLRTLEKKKDVDFSIFILLNTQK